MSVNSLSAMMEQYYNTQPTTGSVFAPLMTAGHHEHRRQLDQDDGTISTTLPSPPSSTSPPSHHHQQRSSLARPVSLIGPVDRLNRRVEEIGKSATGLYRKQYSIDGILGKMESYHSEVQAQSHQTRSPLSSCGGSSPVPVDCSTKG